MNGDVILGADGVPRCAWAGAGDSALGRYHDASIIRNRAKIEATLDNARAMLSAKQLKAQGFRYVGPTSVYAFMQNVGMVNDHVRGCFRASRGVLAASSRS